MVALLLFFGAGACAWRSAANRFDLYSDAGYGWARVGWLLLVGGLLALRFA
jgi:hypothetical protein